jgi:hypothetical protein
VHRTPSQRFDGPEELGLWVRVDAACIRDQDDWLLAAFTQGFQWRLSDTQLRLERDQTVIVLDHVPPPRGEGSASNDTDAPTRPSVTITLAEDTVGCKLLADL